MAKEREKEYKPLSFSTTMRNPARIADFLNCILPFEGQILTEQIIHEVAVNLISKKLYKPTFIGTDPRLKAIYNSEDDFTQNTTKPVRLFFLRIRFISEISSSVCWVGWLCGR